MKKDVVKELDLYYNHITTIMDCIKVAISRGRQYNKDGNMVGSYSEYGIDDIASIIKVKAIRIKNTDN